MSKQIEILDQQREFDGFFKIDVLRFRHTLYRGGWSSEISRELFGRGQAVVVLLYDPVAEKVILVEQCRPGALKHAQQENSQAWLIEPVAGMIDEGETELQACQREAYEEAGVEQAEFEFVCRCYPSPGGSSEILHMYAAEVDSTKLPDHAGLANEDEDIKLITYSFAEAKQKLLNAEFNVATTIIALQWLFFQKQG